MAFIRRPQTLRNIKLESSYPMAFLTALFDRRSFVWLLLGILLIVVQKTAQPRWQSLDDDKSRTMVAEQQQQDAHAAQLASEGKVELSIKNANNKKSNGNEIIRYNTTKRNYYDQGRWLNRYPFLPAVTDVADENRICFVHVGKTAGSTMACYLGFYVSGLQATDDAAAGQFAAVDHQHYAHTLRQLHARTH